MSADTISCVELADALRCLGLNPGDSVIVHSSYRSIAPVEGGPAGVAEALLQAVGPEGNVMLPTFNYSRPVPEPWYDPALTPCRTGIIPELGRQRPGAVRSLHPTHSVAVLGPRAEDLTRDHLEGRALGVGSPLDRLARLGGKVLLLGVGHVSNSAVHVGEEYAGLPKAPYYDEMPTPKVRLPDGRIIEHELDTSPSCSAGFGGVEGELRRMGAVSDARIHGGKVQLMRVQDVLDAVVELLGTRPDALLCTCPTCRPCTGARKRLAEAGKT